VRGVSVIRKKKEESLVKEKLFQKKKSVSVKMGHFAKTGCWVGVSIMILNMLCVLQNWQKERCKNWGFCG
jgi:hypothetical protein